MTTPHPPLEPDRDVQERWLSALSTFALDHLARLGEAPATGALGAEGERVAGQVSRPIGEAPLSGGLEEAVRLIDQAAAASLNTASPGYLAYIPSGGIFAAALADLVSGTVNRYTGLGAAAPALHRLERDVLSWLCREFGYGPEARAVLTSGGSLANFAAVVAARHHHLGDAGRLDGAVVYTSDQAHHSVAKAARLAGIPTENVRALGSGCTWTAPTGAPSCSAPRGAGGSRGSSGPTPSPSTRTRGSSCPTAPGACS